MDHVWGCGSGGIGKVVFNNHSNGIGSYSKVSGWGESACVDCKGVDYIFTLLYLSQIIVD